MRRNRLTYILEKRIGWWVAWGLLAALILLLQYGQTILMYWTSRDVILGLIVGFYGLIAIQATAFLYWSLYAWNDPDEVENNKSPKVFSQPKLSFTALLPVWHEEKVIQDTIAAIASIDYPEDKKELLVLCREDDTRTIIAAKSAIRTAGKNNIRMIIVNDLPVNKPNQLNWGLAQAANEVAVVFDAEDQPHPQIYNIANTIMLTKQVDIVQSGVQLMNYRSNWFSLFNVLEYYFWFKSALHFFARQGVVPLGGNTVFFKRIWLQLAGGWDENCLTEDAEIGMRLSALGAKTAIVYDEIHATREETPPDLAAFIKQRTRWHQGFLQILLKGQWNKLPTIKQRLWAIYILIVPEIVAGLLFIAPATAAWAITIGLPLWITMFSFVPLALLGLQLVISGVGLFSFTRDYKQKYHITDYLRLVFGFIPYLLILTVSSLRALIRFTAGDLSWEKTAHINAHRQPNLAIN